MIKSLLRLVESKVMVTALLKGEMNRNPSGLVAGARAEAVFTALLFIGSDREECA